MSAKPKAPPRALADLLALAGVILVSLAAGLVSLPLALLWLGACCLGLGIWLAKRSVKK
jgi:drug/metabolite transporter (DMT)-like permease